VTVITHLLQQRSDQRENQNHSANASAANNQPENMLENMEVESEDSLAESASMEVAENTENMESENSSMSHATTSTQSQHVCCNKSYVKINSFGSSLFFSFIAHCLILTGTACPRPTSVPFIVSHCLILTEAACPRPPPSF